MQELKPGALLDHGKYRIERVLGQGGFGITYLAIDLGLDKPRAIKEFFPKDYCDRNETTSHVTLGTANTSEFVDKLKNKFIKEARNIANLDQHPGIITIHAVFEENNTAYYVMDYIEGENLSAMVKKDGPLPVEKAVKYITEVGNALEYVHQHHINHLDVKPANIMIRRKDDMPILIDFGLSKQYDSEGLQTSTTPTGISHGYAPFEQYKDGGVKEFSPQTDVYSLAATLYYLVSGKVPPHATDLIENELFFPDGFPYFLKEPISKAMSLKRQGRHETVKKFLNSIQVNNEETNIEVEKSHSIETISFKKVSDSKSLQENQKEILTPANVGTQKNPNQKKNYKQNKSTCSKKNKLILIVSTVFIIAAIILSIIFIPPKNNTSDETVTVRDWNIEKIYEEHPSYRWTSNAVIYEVNLRQFTKEGTINAFKEHLPRLKDLGVDILWFMPVNPNSIIDRKGTLGSYYTLSDYKTFNPEFGTIEQFKSVVEKAHRLNMKVIIDWVAAYTGRDHSWVNQHPDYYQRDQYGKMKGIYDWTDVYVLDYENKTLRNEMMEAMSYWITEIGVDGFRCDVAMEVPTDFWIAAKNHLQKLKPDVFLLAEATVPELQEFAFDMGYNWPLKDLFNQISFTSGQYNFRNYDGTITQFPETHAIAINNLIAQEFDDFPSGSFLMNMITNHDLNAWEGTEFERYGDLTYAFAVLSYTLPGMPLLYTGQETGLNRPFRFFDKDEPPTWNPRNDFFTFYQKLNQLKHSQKALAVGPESGSFISYETSSQDLFIFSRERDESNVTIAVNLGKQDLPLVFTSQDQPNITGMKNYFTGNDAYFPEILKQGEYLIFVNK